VIPDNTIAATDNFQPQPTRRQRTISSNPFERVTIEITIVQATLKGVITPLKHRAFPRLFVFHPHFIGAPVTP
jgi:hypothetical protein